VQRHRWLLRLAATSLATAVGLAGCGGSEPDQDAGGSAAADPGFGHVHGLGVNPADGQLYAATHFGVWRVPTNGEPVRIADRHQDTMGFTIAGPDRFLGSGHPDLREGLPSHLGLIESRDRAQTWRPLSMAGEADFHALEAKHGRIFGYDSTSSTFMVSSDGRTWRRLARLRLYDFTVAPTQPDTVLATGESGLIRSNDGGRTFTAVSNAPALVFVDWIATWLYGLDAAGRVWSSADGGVTWQRRGELRGQPGALAVTGTGQLFAADQDGVVTSRDGGRTFTSVVSYSPGGGHGAGGADR
jgi:hypothetical protein